MAEKGTMQGELQRGWQRFWGLNWKIKSGLAVVLVIILLAIPWGGSGDDKTPAKADVAAVVTATANPTDTPKPTDAPNPTEAPRPTDTPNPTNTPAPTATPVPLTFEQQAGKSYKDNRDFMTRAVGDPIKVTWAADTGELTIDVFPKTLASEGDALTVAGASAIVASKAIWTTYPQVQVLTVSAWTDFTDASGAKTNEPAATTSIHRATGAAFVYDGLKSRALSDNKLFFCGADEYEINIAIWKGIAKIP
jgi:hypothetical protein